LATLGLKKGRLVEKSRATEREDRYQGKRDATIFVELGNNPADSMELGGSVSNRELSGRSFLIRERRG